jgi:hypothetical protein
MKHERPSLIIMKMNNKKINPNNSNSNNNNTDSTFTSEPNRPGPVARHIEGSTGAKIISGFKIF